MMNLATAYKNRIWGDRAENIEQAIDYFQQSLTVMTQEALPFGWATTLNNLANAYSNRIQGDRAENIEHAIDYFQQSLTVMTQTAMPVEWAETMMNLANAYSYRIRGERAESIEQAIDYYQQALIVRTQQAMPVDWAQTMNNLAASYVERIWGDRAENIEQAIDYYQQALTVRTQAAMPVEWAETMNNLAIAYSDRIRGDRAENIEQAIGYYQQALTVRTQAAMPVEWATTLNNLAIANYSRIRGDRAENIEQAIDYYQQALTVMTQAAMPVEWATTLNNLATIYRFRIRGNRAENIEQAINYCQQALTVRTEAAMPIEWATTLNNLANAYSERIWGDRTGNIEQAIAAYQASLSIFKPELLPVNCRGAARWLGNLYSEQQRWQEAALTYQEALRASELLYQSANLLDSKAAELSETGDLPQRAAYALARADNLQAAVLTLEQGRARGLSEILERDQSDLTQLRQTNQDLFNQYEDITTQIRNLEAQQRSQMTSEERYSLTPEAFRTEALRLRQALTETIEHIRQVENYADFLAQPDFNDIIATLKPEQSLVYLVTTTNGSLVLILEVNKDGSSIQPIWQDAFTETNLRSLLLGSTDTATLGGWFGAYSNQHTDRDAWLATIDQVTERLWSNLMEPIVSHLKQRGVNQAVFIPTGLLVFLPLHAAWTIDAAPPTGRHYVLDALQFSYIPNAQSLQAARAIADRTSTHYSLLAVEEPRPTKADELPNAAYEVQTAIASFPNHTLLRHEQSTRLIMQKLLPQHTALHFSGHGFAQLDSPLDSGLVMANDEVLTLRDLFDLKLPGIRLAILSACETGLPGTQLPDEVVSLPTGLLQAGVAGVIASLWAVADISTMMLLVRFYNFWQEENLEPTEALCQAQQWLRDTTNGEKLAYFKSLMQKPSVSKISTGTADYLYKALILCRSGDRDFAHPFHWAAFTYVGV